MLFHVLPSLMLSLAQTVSPSAAGETAPEAETAATDSIAVMSEETPEEQQPERTLDEILNSIPETDDYALPYNKLGGPWIFAGFRDHPTWTISVPEYTAGPHPGKESGMPDWLLNAMTAERLQDNSMYYMMVKYPHLIEYAYWDLPVPPSLPEDDISFANYIRRLDLPEVNMKDAVIPEFRIERTHWLHTFGSSLQFSQAYVSSNWYQGGNNYLSLLVNLGWNVQLNRTYHPNLLFESNLSYKLGLNQSPNDEYHKYSISEDLFQYNLQLGLKALRKWYYSFNLQFKTQLFTSYPNNSDKRKASFLSPGDLNVGVGMTYSYNNNPKTFKINASLSPISYNLKTCIDHLIDEKQFNIKPGCNSHSEIGTSGEVNVDWSICQNISCKSRLFLFTNYNYFLGDLETTFNFAINKFLSTQLYVHLRYDSSSDAMSSQWRHWMLKEILSFGLSYTISTKPS